MNNEYTKDNLELHFLEGYENFKTERLQSAFDWAYNLHKEQFRKSGQPYVIHPIEVTRQLMALSLDEDTLIAALLHDVIEDCGVKHGEIEKKFGKVVADLVLAETKVDDLTSNAYIKFSDYNNLKRMLIAMSDDVRVIIIRLSDRLHNMKTIQYLKPERQITYSQETLNVYVPLAEYLNIGSWKRELEEIAFRYAFPEQSELLESLIKEDPRTNPKNIASVQSQLEKLLRDNKIPCVIEGRIKSIPSIHNKIKKHLLQGKITTYSLEKINDVLAFRLITQNNNIIDCYKALGVIHSKFKYYANRFDDYIAKPKDNGYQSLQTDISVRPDGCDQDVIIELQIKTKQMHENNEYGAASHISYKNKGLKDNISWVKNLVKWQSNGNQKFSIKNVLGNKIFVFTPKGQVIELAKGATVIDFAYRIHTKIGNSCTGAKIDGKIVPLNTILSTGEIVEIIISKNKSIPNVEWLSWCNQKTGNIIRREISKKDIESQIEKGKAIFKQKLKDLDTELTQLEFDAIINDLAGGIEEDFYRKVFLKMISATHAINQIKKKKKFEEKEEYKELPKAILAGQSVILVQGHKGMQYYFAKCCTPSPNDDVVGFISLQHGVTVHKKSCKCITYLDPLRLVDVSWE